MRSHNDYVGMAQRGVARGMVTMALCVLPLSGCIPLPFASPPVRGQVGYGYAVADSAHGPVEEGGTAKVESSSALVVRGSAHPLGLVQDLSLRTVEFGVGYTIEHFLPDAFTKHGPALAFGLRPSTWTLSRGMHLRVMVEGWGELLMADVGHGTELGPGFTLQATLEIFGFLSGPFEDSTAEYDGPHFRSADPADPTGHPRPRRVTRRTETLGAGWGENGIGLYGSMSYRHFDREEYWLLGVGLSVRLPATGGLLLFYPWG